MAAMAAMLQIHLFVCSPELKAELTRNLEALWWLIDKKLLKSVRSEIQDGHYLKYICPFVSWTERPIDLKFSVKHRDEM